MRRHERCVRMRRVEPVFFYPREALSRVIGKINLRRLVRRGTGDDQASAVLVHHCRVGEPPFGQPPRLAWAKIIDRVHMLFENVVLIAGEEQTMVRFVYANKAGHDPCAMGNWRPLAIQPSVNVMVAGPLRAPNQAAVTKRTEIIVEVDPRLGCFPEEQPTCTGCRVDSEQIESLLVAAFALDVKYVPVL